MPGNIACSFPNCPRPVIGQCTGYKGDCRKYYCAIHSTDNLCYSCASKKVSEEREALTKQEYLEIISEIKSKARTIGWNVFWGHKMAKWGIGVTLLFGLLGLIFGINDEKGVLFLWSGGLSVVIGMLILFFVVGEQEDILATDIDQQKPGFLNFFAEWRMEKQKKTWATIGTVIGFIFVIALAAAASSSESNSEDARVKKAVDDELDRRGM